VFGSDGEVVRIIEIADDVTGQVEMERELAEQVGVSAEQLSSGAEEQATQAEEVATAMEEMTRTIAKNSEAILRTDPPDQRPRAGQPTAGQPTDRAGERSGNPAGREQDGRDWGGR